MDYITALVKAPGIEVKKMMPFQAGDVSETSADTKALYDVIGFKPEKSIKKGVVNFVEWYINIIISTIQEPSHESSSDFYKYNRKI